MTTLARLVDDLRRHWLLGILVLAGILLRVSAVVAEWPAVMVYGDSYSYLYNAAHLGPEPFHPLGYPLVLAALWWTGGLQWVVVLQHLLGILLSIAIYATLRKLGVRRWLAALGVAPLLLDAYQVFLEQNILAETVFEGFTTASLIVIVWSRDTRLRWVAGVVAGLLIGAAVLTRGVGLAAIPVVFLVPLLSGRGWRQPAAILLTAIVLVAGYSAWNYRIDGQFTFDQYSGRWLYGRVETFVDCRQLQGIPPDERGLCDHPYGRDPKGVVAVDDGVGFYVWDPRSPLYRLKPEPHRTLDQIAEDYALRVVVSEPLPYLWSVVLDTARYFAPTRQEVAAGQSPLASQNFQPVTDPGQNHVLIGTQSFADQTAVAHLPGPQTARWPVSWLDRYQTVGYTPGPVLAVCLILVLISAAWRSRDPGGHARREAALLFGLTGLFYIVFPAATAGVEARYLLPALPLVPPAGAVAIESLSGPARRAAGRWRERLRTGRERRALE